MAKITVTLFEYIIEYIGRNRIGSNGFQAIGLSNFKDLQKLNLIENDLTDQIKNGNELFDIPNLKEIHLIGCGI